MAKKPELYSPAQIAILARQIAMHLPKVAAASFAAGTSSLRRRRKKSSKKYINPMIVDTSVLIDGRIADVATSGFIFGTLLVISGVVEELHKLSDSSDDLKRARGRRGLDVLSALRKIKGIKVEIIEQDVLGGDVDAKVLALSKKVKGSLLTLDYNLNKVGSVRGVRILNLNELASALKTAVLPHEVLTLKINTIGKEKNQGVGYLEDGTMVVVEDGAKLKGKTVNVEVLRVLATAAGKMIFAKKSV